MAVPTVVDLPHSLGRDEVRRRLRDRIGELPTYVPGGVADVRETWPSPDRMMVEVAALGQRCTATIDIHDTLVRVSFTVPGLFGFMSGRIADAVRRKGGQALLDGPSRN